MGIQYKIKTASTEDIRIHLVECNSDFEPPLEEKVNILEYSEKIYNKSVTFEAWLGNTLVGLIAAYFTDNVNKYGYITSVSISNKYQRKGIASELMNICIEYAKGKNFQEISLEVSQKKIAAKNLYKKFGFFEFEKKPDIIIMKIRLV